ncbi:MAG: hypothetical protein CMP20_15345 [Rickettsiales bacterium]|nr:hypothetical protein [Rickettsiales bacterium]
MDELPPEVLHLLAYSGQLKAKDVLSLALSSKALNEKLFGDQYSQDYFTSLGGFEVCLDRNNLRSMKNALRLIDSVDNSILSQVVWRGNVDAMRLLLDWRGPDAEFFDPRHDEYDVVIDAAVNNSRMFSLLLDWRGPNGEWVDVRQTLYCMFDICSDACVITALLNWRGPNGEWVDARFNNAKLLRNFIQMNSAEIVAVLLDWRGPNDEWIDPTVFNNCLIQVACKSASIQIIRLLLDWKGPDGLQVDPTTNNYYALKCARYRGTLRVFDSYPQFAELDF